MPSSHRIDLLHMRGDLSAVAQTHLVALTRNLMSGAFAGQTAQMELACVRIAEQQHVLALAMPTASRDLATRIVESVILALGLACSLLGIPRRNASHPTCNRIRTTGLSSYQASLRAARFLAASDRPTWIQISSSLTPLSLSVELGRPFGSCGGISMVLCTAIVDSKAARSGTVVVIMSGTERLRLLIPAAFDLSRLRPGCMIELSPILGTVQRRVVRTRPCQAGLFES